MSEEKDPEGVTSDDGPLGASGHSSAEHSESPKEPSEEPEAISFLGALRIPVSPLLHTLVAKNWGKKKSLLMSSSLLPGRGGVLPLPAVCQAGELHLPLLAAPLHRECW